MSGGDPLPEAASIIAEAARLEHAGQADVASELRRRLTRDDPMLFALVYLGRHLTDDGTGRITLSDVHKAWAKTAKKWAQRQTRPARSRRAEIAPREMGKTTWWFLLLPMWAAAHGHVRFAAAFADSSKQAETHLATFKSELDNNPLIRADFPDLVEPKRRERGQVAADRVSLYHARSGFVFAAAGADSRNLGLKVGDRRPDLIIVDDIEPHEEAYSARLAEKRLATLREAIFPLNVKAHVIIVGTVTMQGSIVHQIVKRRAGQDAEDVYAWVDEDRIKARHWLPIITGDDGERASVWPAKWPLAFLESIEHTRQYAKNYANDPLGADGDYWQIEDFRRLAFDDVDPLVEYEVISVDPAVTSNDSSDFTGISAVGFAPELKQCVVYEARALRVPPDKIRLAVIAAAERALMRGHHVLVIVETNQGGDLWATRVLHDLPFKVKAYTVSAPKPVRATDALDHYQRGRVAHAAGLGDVQGQMVAFPRAPHDDLVDSVGAGVRYFLSKKRRPRASAESVAYA
jgi:phage terminase large subunit-like protein